MTTITLTQQQRALIKTQMDQQTEMLSDQEVEALATQLNEQIDIPFLKEGTEQTVFVKIVKKFDRILYKNLPNELYGLVQDPTNGISDEAAAELQKVLARRMNANFNLPYIPENIEQEIFEVLVGLILNAMRRNLSVLKGI